MAQPPTLDANRLNRACRCALLDKERLRTLLRQQDDGERLFEMIIEQRPHLASDAWVFLSQADYQRQRHIIEALERVIALPAYRETVLRHAPDSAHHTPKARGVFLGYDFHLSDDGPKLIEINSNAGGALLNVTLAPAYAICGAEPVDMNHEQIAETTATRFVAMFQQEWQREHPDAPLRTLAIVDEQPDTQYMLPEFLLFRNLFKRHGIETYICDPGELVFRAGALYHHDTRIDLVYNRLTDFALQAPEQSDLLAAYLQDAVVVTPHPQNHALYADKRNLALLCDDTFLESLGVDDETQERLINGIAHTQRVDASQADELWQRRKHLFFKPAKGYGSKAAYRGDKLTRGVFSNVLQADYVAQNLITPSTRQLMLEGVAKELKLDLRHYVYQGQTQWLCARLYQGQTTNFRTPGGGFAPVIIV